MLCKDPQDRLSTRTDGTCDVEACLEHPFHPSAHLRPVLPVINEEVDNQRRRHTSPYPDSKTESNLKVKDPRQQQTTSTDEAAVTPISPGGLPYDREETERWDNFLMPNEIVVLSAVLRKVICSNHLLMT